MIEKNSTILLVEDDNDTREFMRFLLELDNFVVYEAVNGAEGVEMAKTHLPNIILMDMSMPVMDGLTAIRHLRDYEPTSKMPIVAITAHGNLYARHVSGSEFNELLAKPVDFKQLYQILNKYLATNIHG